jgi:hypothetical protein
VASGAPDVAAPEETGPADLSIVGMCWGGDAHAQSAQTMGTHLLTLGTNTRHSTRG